jgi:hypothetical protein
MSADAETDPRRLSAIVDGCPTADATEAAGLRWSGGAPPGIGDRQRGHSPPAAAYEPAAFAGSSAVVSTNWEWRKAGAVPAVLRAARRSRHQVLTITRA